jgi:hypothetical protein
MLLLLPKLAHVRFRSTKREKEHPTMARWEKRLKACGYAGWGRSKMDYLIGLNLVEAKKEDGGRNAPVWINLDSIDAYKANMRKALGLRNIPKAKRERRERPPQHPEP